jgi:hypothetical protein
MADDSKQCFNVTWTRRTVLYLRKQQRDTDKRPSGYDNGSNKATNNQSPTNAVSTTTLSQRCTID